MPAQIYGYGAKAASPGLGQRLAPALSRLPAAMQEQDRRAIGGAGHIGGQAYMRAPQHLCLNRFHTRHCYAFLMTGKSTFLETPTMAACGKAFPMAFPQSY